MGVTILFGAGASYGSGECSPSNPPLGDQLFSHLIAEGGSFSRLDASCIRVFEENGFEAGMAAIPDDNRTINPLQKELACYLSGFVAGPGNAYKRLLCRLRPYLENVTLSTLNYDLLIEQALGYMGLGVNYAGDNDGVPLLKLHGSSNFLPQLGRNIMASNTMLGCGTFVDGLPIDFARSQAEVREWCANPANNDISPVVAMYEKRKRVVVNRAFVEKIQEAYSRAVATASLVVLVGVKYIEHDEHVWGPIGKSNAKLLIVDPYPAATEEWAMNCGLKVNVVRDGFYHAVWTVFKAIRSSLSGEK